MRLNQVETAARHTHARSRLTRLPVLAFILASVIFQVPDLPSRAQDPQDDEVVRVATDLVVLNVTATNAGNEYVHGLERANFKVYEDGQEQSITNFSREETPFAAALLLDVSGSMEGRVSMARSAAIRFLDGLRAEDTAAVYSFHRKVEQVQGFSQSRDLSPMAYNLAAKGQTALHDAIVQAAADLSNRPEKRRAIIVLSDGADTCSKASSDKALASALNVNATVYTVDMAEKLPGSPNTAQAAGVLRDYAAKSGGRFVLTPGGKALRDAFGEILKELSNQYTIGYHTSNRIPDGRWRSIEVKVDRPEVKARTRRGYRLAKTAKSKGAPDR
ncbi:MAG TPA: VWA domain-containing protein [Pyrinomonadaceae bacterium]|nr:VWA domain-containing protein [Pyrinomonadaceae bacterium]